MAAEVRGAEACVFAVEVVGQRDSSQSSRTVFALMTTGKRSLSTSVAVVLRAAVAPWADVGCFPPSAAEQQQHASSYSPMSASMDLEPEWEYERLREWNGSSWDATAGPAKIAPDGVARPAPAKCLLADMGGSEACDDPASALAWAARHVALRSRAAR